MTQQPVSFPFVGGMDLITPAVKKPPGRVIAALNYEPVATGYRRVGGFERFDGRTAPHEALAYLIFYDANGTGNNVSQFMTGDAIRDTSGGTIIGYAANNALLVSGTWGTPTAIGLVKIWPLDNVTTPFVNNNDMWVGAVRYGYQQSDISASVQPSDQFLAATQARARITAAIGASGNTGGIKHIFTFEDEVYCLRHAPTGGTVGQAVDELFKATSAGWVVQRLGYLISFNSGGATEIVEGDTITGSVSGATGTVKWVSELTSGSWAGGDAVGTMIVDSGGGAMLAAADNILVAAVNLATVVGAAGLNFSPADIVDSYVYNFFGDPDLKKVYFAGCDYDGDVIVPFQELSPIVGSSMPGPCAAYKNHHFSAWEGGQLVWSQPGLPRNYDAALGAGDLNVGEEIVDLIPLASALVILCENKVKILYGNDSSDFTLVTHSDKSGSAVGSSQDFGGDVLYIDDGGLRRLSSSARFGDFNLGTLTSEIQPLLSDYRRDGVLPVASWLIRSRNQYWVIYSNGTGFSVCFSKKQPEILPFDFDLYITCAHCGEVDGAERIFLGADDGFVYEFDVGTSFDGDGIEHYVALAYFHGGAPQQLKRFHKAIIDVQANGQTTLSLAARIDNGGEVGLAEQELIVTTGGSAIDDLGSNELYFASQIETEAEAYLGIVGRNLSLWIGGNTQFEMPHTLTGATLLISPRGLRR